MNETPEARPLGPSPSPISRAIKASAIGLLVAGGLCLYFGMTLIADAPGSVSSEEAERWFAVDNAFFWCLRIVGAAFVITAGLAFAGMRAAMLLATICEGAFALLMVVMSIAWTVEARVDGQFNALVILLLIMAVLAVRSALQTARLYRAAGVAGPRDQGDIEPV